MSKFWPKICYANWDDDKGREEDELMFQTSKQRICLYTVASQFCNADQTSKNQSCGAGILISACSVASSNRNCQKVIPPPAPAMKKTENLS